MLGVNPKLLYDAVEEEIQSTLNRDVNFTLLVGKKFRKKLNLLSK